MAFVEQIVTGIRQTKRWLIASAQDQHPAIAMLHANYAVGNIDLLKQMWTEKEITAATGEHIDQLMKEATAAQDRAQRRLQEACPELVP